MSSVDAIFIREFLTRLQEEFRRGLDLHEGELSPEALPATEPQAERAARLAEAVGFDGNTFRNLLPEGEAWTVARAQRRLKKQIELLPRVIAALEASPNRPTVSDGADLLNIHEVAVMLDMGESTVRSNNRKGLLPSPVRIGGAVRWSRKDLQAWIDAGSPSRTRWEATRKGRKT